jgi:succinoglycan biosynthesis transport protein ExoP
LYQATSKVAIFPEVPNVLGFKDAENVAPDYEYEATLETQVAILRSDALALKVIEGMRLYQDPRFTTVKQGAPESPMGEPSMQPDPVQVAGLLGAFRGGLNVQPVPSTRLIQVSYTHSDPRFATEITNALVKTFIEENFSDPEMFMKTSPDGRAGSGLLDKLREKEADLENPACTGNHPVWFGLPQGD